MKLTDKLNNVVDATAVVKTTTKKTAAPAQEPVAPPPKPEHIFRINNISAIMHTTCCGLGEVYGFKYGSTTKTKKEVLKTQLELLSRIKVGAVVGTLVDHVDYDYSSLKEDLLQLGCWNEGTSFINPNTGRTITMWSSTKADMEREYAK